MQRGHVALQVRGAGHGAGRRDAVRVGEAGRKALLVVGGSTCCCTHSPLTVLTGRGQKGPKADSVPPGHAISQVELAHLPARLGYRLRVGGGLKMNRFPRAMALSALSAVRPSFHDPVPPATPHLPHSDDKEQFKTPPPPHAYDEAANNKATAFE